MEDITLNTVCNIQIDIRCNLKGSAPVTFILSSGYSIEGFDEPIQVALIELLERYGVKWVQYIYPERNPKNSMEDLYISTGCYTLDEVYRWVKTQVKDSIGLFGISFGANISLELALRATVETLIIVNAVFDYVDFRTKQLGEDAISRWAKDLITKLPYQDKALPLGYRFIQEAMGQKLEERAAGLGCRVHAFQGDADNIISPQHILRLAGVATNWYPHVVVGADHPFNTQKAIDGFISTIQPIIKSLSRNNVQASM
jgi:hypothetical protein